MSVPIKKCLRLFDALTAGEKSSDLKYIGHRSSPRIHAQSLYAAVAAIVLNETQGDFNEKKLFEETLKLGYKANYATFGETVKNLVVRQVIYMINAEDYRLDTSKIE